jgi:hypothetical protein
MVTPNNASKWQMGFNSAFEGLMQARKERLKGSDD